MITLKWNSKCVQFKKQCVDCIILLYQCENVAPFLTLYM